MKEEKQIEQYYQNIRTMIMVKNNLNYNSLDNIEVEEWLNKKAKHIFRTIFEFEYEYKE